MHNVSREEEVIHIQHNIFHFEGPPAWCVSTCIAKGRSSHPVWNLVLPLEGVHPLNLGVLVSRLKKVSRDTRLPPELFTKRYTRVRLCRNGGQSPRLLLLMGPTGSADSDPLDQTCLCFRDTPEILVENRNLADS